MDVNDLVGRVDRLPATRLETEAWRHVSTGRPPMSGEGARMMGGRWNPPRSFAVLYLGASVQTVVAEFHRLAEKQRVAAETFLPRTLYRYDLTLGNVLDLRATTALAELGVGRSDVVGISVNLTQALGEAAFACGREGIVAPSATGCGDVIAVFPERLMPGSRVRDEVAQLWETVPEIAPE